MEASSYAMEVYSLLLPKEKGDFTKDGEAENRGGRNRHTHTQGLHNFWNKSVKDIKHGGRRKKTLVAGEGMFIQPSPSLEAHLFRAGVVKPFSLKTPFHPKIPPCYHSSKVIEYRYANQIVTDK